MKYEIKGTPLPVVICSLEKGESVKTERGAMSWMNTNMKMSTNAGGSVGKAFSRVFSGESMFQNIYTAEESEGLIAFASTFPGEILAIEINESSGIIAQKTAFLASETSVNMDVYFQKKLGASFFGGEGFIMQRFSGKGFLFLEIDGSVVTYNLEKGESMVIDTGYLACADMTVSINIQQVKGLGNKLFGGEGLFNTVVTGPGRIWLQTMPVNAVAGVLAPFFSGNK